MAWLRHNVCVREAVLKHCWLIVSDPDHGA
jgi:hypothetical protein